LVFDFLPPGNYWLRAIRDMNQNEKWDTGDYFAKRQPEEVINYSGPVNLRANWEMELDWEIK
jgi:uncharacterized protein (DUF2141 family)